MAVDVASDKIIRWTFAEVEQVVQRAAGALLAAGVRPGDRVALLLGDAPEFPFAYFGAIAAGAVAMPLSSQLASIEVETILRDAAPKVVVATGINPDYGDAAILSPADLRSGPMVPFADTRADDPALLVFTSGSGGRPKGVLHAQRAFWARQSMHKGWHDIRADDRVMHAGAFNWTFTLGVGLADTWSVGATAILNTGSRAPEVWSQLAARHRPMVFAAAPAVYRRVLKYGADLRRSFATLRHAVTAGERLAPSIAEEWCARTGKPLLEALGMSEVSTYISTPPDREPVPGHAGWPQPGRRVAVLGEDSAPVAHGSPGELSVHASDPGLMLGYWQRPDLTGAAFCGDWFRTGDLVTMREDGAIAYIGRADDQMNAQGFRVDPHDVEEVLVAHPGVAECGAATLPIDDGLSVIAAWVVPAESASLSRDDLLAQAQKTLAAYKVPREFFKVESLPHTPNGKLVRRLLPGMQARKL